MKNNVKKEKCLIKTTFFGNKIYEHYWVYKNKKERKCFGCGQKQIFFGFVQFSGGIVEDWREKYDYKHEH